MGGKKLGEKSMCEKRLVIKNMGENFVKNMGEKRLGKLCKKTWVKTLQNVFGDKKHGWKKAWVSLCEKA